MKSTQPFGSQRAPLPPSVQNSNPTDEPTHVVLAVAAVAGVLLGLFDVMAQRALPYPWANLANSGAVWALGAFVIGMWVGPRAGRAAAAGVVLLLVAVESYYVSAVYIQNDSTSTLWNATTQYWLVLAVVVGALFGAAGALAHSDHGWIRGGAAALAGLVFLTEAVYTVARPSGGGGLSNDDRQTALIEAACAVIVALVVLAVQRRRRRSTSDPTICPD